MLENKGLPEGLFARNLSMSGWWLTCVSGFAEEARGRSSIFTGIELVKGGEKAYQIAIKRSITWMHQATDASNTPPVDGRRIGVDGWWWCL